jgi:hypothetical protein
MEFFLSSTLFKARRETSTIKKKKLPHRSNNQTPPHASIKGRGQHSFFNDTMIADFWLPGDTASTSRKTWLPPTCLRVHCMCQPFFFNMFYIYSKIELPLPNLITTN